MHSRALASFNRHCFVALPIKKRNLAWIVFALTCDGKTDLDHTLADLKSPGHSGCAGSSPALGTRRTNFDVPAWILWKHRPAGYLGFFLASIYPFALVNRVRWWLT